MDEVIEPAPEIARPPLKKSMTAAPMSVGEIEPGEPCANCDAPMQGPFCFACGQPKKGLIRHLSGIVADFFDTVFNVDSRTLRTVLPLYFRPGWLSNEYFAGRRVRYVTPLRLYFFLSVILFLVISTMASTEHVRLDAGDRINEGPALTQAQREARAADIERVLAMVPEEGRAEMRREFDREQKRDLKRAEEDRAWGPPAPRKPDDDMQVVIFGGKPWHKTENPLTFTWLSGDLNNALNDEIEEIIGKGKAVRKDPKPFIKEVFSIAPQALFLILPIFALLLKVMYVFKRRLYMEHLIVALHSHSYLCLSILLLIGLGAIGERVQALAKATEILAVVAGIWMPVYLYIMQKKVYRQGYILTTLKFGVIGVLYTILLSFGLVATMIAGLIFL
jgi:hypothetical protein